MSLSSTQSQERQESLSLSWIFYGKQSTMMLKIHQFLTLWENFSPRNWFTWKAMYPLCPSDLIPILIKEFEMRSPEVPLTILYSITKEAWLVRIIICNSSIKCYGKQWLTFVWITREGEVPWVELSYSRGVVRFIEVLELGEAAWEGGYFHAKNSQSVWNCLPKYLLRDCHNNCSKYIFIIWSDGSLENSWEADNALLYDFIVSGYLSYRAACGTLNLLNGDVVVRLLHSNVRTSDHVERQQRAWIICAWGQVVKVKGLASASWLFKKPSPSDGETISYSH